MENSEYSELERSFLEQPGGCAQFPLELQIRLLGIDKETLNRLRGKNVLDPCCGNRGKLVEYLREHEINAEGIDSNLEVSKPYLMRRTIGVDYMGKGTIPRQEEYYEEIFMHSFAPIVYPLSGLRAFDRLSEVSGVKLEASLVMTELLRVLKKGGRIVSVPAMRGFGLTYLGERALLIEHLEIEKRGEEPNEFINQFSEITGDSSEDLIKVYNYRTIITKN